MSHSVFQKCVRLTHLYRPARKDAVGEEKTSQESRKAAPRTYHRLSRCQAVFTKICHQYYCRYWYCHYCHYQYCHNLIFWVLSQFELLSFVTIWVLSQFEFCHKLIFFSFVTILVFEVFYLIFLSFFTIWVFEFCDSLISWVLSQLDFWFFSQFEFLNFVTIWVFEFCYNLSF